jgi:thiol-disulfide isomerase/thioredoxin
MRGRARRRPWRVAPALACAAVLAGCAGTAPGVQAPSLESRIDVDTAELREAKADLGVEPCPEPEGPGSGLPELTLPCLGGGREVTLSDLSGPAVIPLWASWCVSCPDELPLFQRLSDRNAGRLTVLGVDWQDTQPGKAMALLELTGSTMPQLADPGGELAEHYRLSGLPGILLVDGEGTVHFELGVIDDYAELAALVEQHTGVRVRGR